MTGAAEITIKRKRRATHKYYEIMVTPQAGGAERKLRIDHSTPFTLLGNLIDEKITALFDGDGSNLAYEVVTNGQPVIAYAASRQRLLAEAQSSAQSLSGAGMWILAILLTLVGAGGAWVNAPCAARTTRSKPLQPEAQRCTCSHRLRPCSGTCCAS